MIKYLIVGNGPAGLDAALSIRKNDQSGEISIISRSKNLHYYRPRIVEYITGAVSLEKMTIYDEDFYKKNNINNFLNKKISSIDPFDKVITDISGKQYNYDKLLLATGGRPVLPEIVGIQKKGVFTLRGISDADKIISHVEGNQRIIIIGGGLLGIEIANNLTSIGCDVCIIESASHLLPRQLDATAGELLKRLLEKKGVKFITGETVKSINGDEFVKSITLHSGDEVPVDTVIVSAGIIPNLSIAEGLEIDINRGFVVNKYFETSIKNIYAAGDAAEYNEFTYGLWLIAKEQGRIAGLNMAGIPTEYQGSVVSSTLKVTDIDLYSAGEIDNVEYESHTREAENSYVKVFIDNKSVKAVIVVGDKYAVKTARKVMTGHVPYEELLK